MNEITKVDFGFAHLFQGKKWLDVSYPDVSLCGHNYC
jgi:hypothetical protein